MYTLTCYIIVLYNILKSIFQIFKYRSTCIVHIGKRVQYLKYFKVRKRKRNVDRELFCKMLFSFVIRMHVIYMYFLNYCHIILLCNDITNLFSILCASERLHTWLSDWCKITWRIIKVWKISVCNNDHVIWGKTKATSVLITYSSYILNNENIRLNRQ